MGKRNPPDEKAKFVRLERAVVEEISNFLFQVGNQFVSIKNASGAFDCFKYATDLNPQHQPAVYNLGSLYSITGNHEGAYRMFKEALRMRPEDLMSRVALSEVARKVGKMGEARELLAHAYKVDPENYNVLSAMAILEYDSGNIAQAMELNKRSLDMKPGDLHMILNNALINMMYGRWKDYWAQYEYCLSYQKNPKMRHLSMSDAWAGQDMEGKTLLVVSDQGSGDAIQFSRYLAEAKRKGKFAKLIYLVQAELRDLLSRVDGVDEAIGFEENLKVDYDAYSSLLGIMRVLGITPQDCWRPPHIVTNKGLDNVWKHRLAEYSSRPRVGIAWAGDPRHGNDHARSLPLSQFLKLLFGNRESGPPDCQLFSFQVGPAAKQLTSAPIDDDVDIVDLGSDFRSFDDTASAMANMDLMISCDTSVVHLAGSMGIPCWVLVSNPPEWRWLMDIGNTPWYYGVKIYRQNEPRNWGPVMDAVLSDLNQRLASQEAQ